MARQDDDKKVLRDEMVTRFPLIREREKEQLDALEVSNKLEARWAGQEEIRARLKEEKARIQAHLGELLSGVLEEAIRLMKLIGVEEAGTMSAWINDGKLFPSSNSMTPTLYAGDDHTELHDTRFFRRNLESESAGLHFVTDLEGIKQVESLMPSPPQPPQRVIRQYRWVEHDPESYQRMIAESFADLKWHSRREPEPQRDLTFGTRGR